MGAVISSQYEMDSYRISGGPPSALVILSKCLSEESLAAKDFVSELDVDLIWVNSYSMTIREDILRTPRLGGNKLCLLKGRKYEWN